MSHPQRHTVRVRADHSVVLQSAAWMPGQTVVVVVLDESSAVAPYSALQTLQSSELDTPEEFSSSYEGLIKQQQG